MKLESVSGWISSFSPEASPPLEILVKSWQCNWEDWQLSLTAIDVLFSNYIYTRLELCHHSPMLLRNWQMGNLKNVPMQLTARFGIFFKREVEIKMKTAFTIIKGTRGLRIGSEESSIGCTPMPKFDVAATISRCFLVSFDRQLHLGCQWLTWVCVSERYEKTVLRYRDSYSLTDVTHLCS